MNLLSVILVANVNIFHNFFVFVNCLGHTQIFLFVFLKRQSDSKYSPVPPVWACFPWLNWRGLTKDLERPFQLILNLDLWIKVCGPDLKIVQFICTFAWFMEKEMATHSRILPWKIPWTEEPGGLYSPWGQEESDKTERLSTHTNDLRRWGEGGQGWKQFVPEIFRILR